MHGGAGEEREWVVEREDGEGGEQVEGLQDGDGLDGGVEEEGERVPEDLGPEVGVDGGGEVVWFFWGLDC